MRHDNLFAIATAFALGCPACRPFIPSTSTEPPVALRVGEAEFSPAWTMSTEVESANQRQVPVRGLAWADLNDELPLDLLGVLRPEERRCCVPESASFLFSFFPLTPTDPWLHEVDPWQDLGATGLVAGQLDADQNIDLFMSLEGEIYDYYGRVQYPYLGDGSGSFRFGEYFGPYTQATSGALQDVDLDGDLDIIVGGPALADPNETIQIFANDGLANFTPLRSVDDGQTAALDARPPEGPTEPMIVSTSWQKVAVYDTSLTLLYSAPFSAGGDVAWLDANGDAGPDFVANDPESGPGVWVSSGTSFEQRWQAGRTECAPSVTCEVAAADLDGDGDDDFVVAGEALAFFENDGTGQFTRTSSTPGPWRAVVAADRDGDGDVDLAAGGTEQIVVFDNDASPE